MAKLFKRWYINFDRSIFSNTGAFTNLSPRSSVFLKRTCTGTAAIPTSTAAHRAAPTWIKWRDEIEGKGTKGIWHRENRIPQRISGLFHFWFRMEKNQNKWKKIFILHLFIWKKKFIKVNSFNNHWIRQAVYTGLNYDPELNISGVGPTPNLWPAANSTAPARLKILSHPSATYKSCSKKLYTWKLNLGATCLLHPFL